MSVEAVALHRRATRFSCLLHSAAAASSRASCSPRTPSHSPFDSDASRATGGSRTPPLRRRDGAPTGPNQQRHFCRGPHDLLLLPPAINSCQPQGHRVARRPWVFHTHLRAVREGGAAPASRSSLEEAVAAAACRRPLATLRRRRSRRSTFRRSPRRAPYASPTQVKVEKKDEGLEAMRKLMGGAADEDEEEAG